nr:MAG TPA: hypothetical protein [Caudoviricetes sp.]
MDVGLRRIICGAYALIGWRAGSFSHLELKIDSARK